MYKKFYKILLRAAHFFSHIFLLFLRAFWGTQLLFIGLGKFAYFPEVVASFTNMQIPMPRLSVVFAALIECVGGISFIIGLFSRIMSLLLMLFFMMVFILAHPEKLFRFFAEPELLISERAFLFLLISMTIFSFGPGLFSLDSWLERKKL